MFKKFVIKLLKALGLVSSTPAIEAPTNEQPLDDNGPSHPPPTTSRKYTLGVIVGHSKKSPGATFFSGTNEYAYNSEVAAIMEAYSKNLNNVNVEVIYRDNITISEAYARAFSKGCDVVVELHCNAFNKSARGTLTYVSSEAADIEYAHQLQAAMVTVFGTEGRPVSTEAGRGVQVISRKHRGGGNVYGYLGMPNCLVEPAFCDEQKDCALLLTRKNDYAKALVDASNLWARKKGLI